MLLAGRKGVEIDLAAGVLVSDAKAFCCCHLKALSKESCIDNTLQKFNLLKKPFKRLQLLICIGEVKA